MSWLDGLMQGPTGPTGATGPTGPTGPEGPGTVSGTNRHLARFSATTTIGDSAITENNGNFTVPMAQFTITSNDPSPVTVFKIQSDGTWAFGSTAAATQTYDPSAWATSSRALSALSDLDAIMVGYPYGSDLDEVADAVTELKANVANLQDVVRALISDLAAKGVIAI